MLTCILIEDQAPAQRILQKYLTDFGQWKLLGSFTNTLEAQELLDKEPVDVLFLDIHLPRTSGMDFLKQLAHPPVTILTTAFSQYAVESYEYRVADYLVKPFSYDRFLKAVHKAENLLNIEREKNEGMNCVIKSGHEYIRFNSRDVVFICTDMDYTEIHLEDRKLLSSETLSHWEHQLEAQGFVRIHKSYLVNLAQIEKRSSSQVTLQNGMELPIGRAYKETLVSKWDHF